MPGPVLVTIRSSGMSSIFKQPSDYSWPFVIFLYITSAAFAAWVFVPIFFPQKWSVPSKDQLRMAEGHFLPVKSSIKSPYLFQANDGTETRLGCSPLSGMADCLGDIGGGLATLSQQHVQIGYFTVPNWHMPALSNVLVTMSVNGVPLMNYSDSRQRMEKWAIRKVEIDHSLLTIVAGAFFPVASLLFAIWLTIAKRAEDAAQVSAGRMAKAASSRLLP